jgi:HKD family nuclease
MEGLWTNRNSLSDFVQNGLRLYGADVSSIYAAVAFFTESDVVNELANSSCHVRLVVRLGFPTSPKALSAINKNPNIELRYYSDKSFHPKLYIFGDRVAFVGSANLTRSALLTNQEIMVSIESEDPRFGELASLFSDYWNEAQVLTPDNLAAYSEIYKKHSKAINEISLIDEETESKVGKSVFPNINRGKKNKSKENIFLDNYRKTYQESVAAFKKIKSVYEQKQTRKTESCPIPLRLEIDSFFSFVRDVHATQETWKETTLGWSEEKQIVLSDQIDEWLNREWPHFDETICNENYPKIVSVLGAPETIDTASFDDIIGALVVLHSFHDRLRFFPGGLETLLKAFRSGNELDHVKYSIKHLLYGKGDIVKRMADLIYDSSYKLNEFGQSNVQELVGWINKEELPVINGRTTKVLRYYGFDVRQL